MNSDQKRVFEWLQSRIYYSNDYPIGIIGELNILSEDARDEAKEIFNSYQNLKLDEEWVVLEKLCDWYKWYIQKQKLEKEDKQNGIE